MRPVALSGIGQQSEGTGTMVWIAIIAVAGLIFWGTIREPKRA